MSVFSNLKAKWIYLRIYSKLPKDAKTKKFWPSETYNKYPKGHTFNGKRVLNLGCGTQVYEVPNVVNLDGYPGKGVDIIWDLSKTPLPFKDQEFDFIIANHVMEHIPNWFECFKELARVLKVGGKMEVFIPSVSSDSAFTYRDHINYIGVESFWGCLNFGGRSNNLWANTEDTKTIGNVKNLFITSVQHRPIVTWWATFAPHCIVNFLLTHLRNMSSETGFYFEKVRHD